MRANIVKSHMNGYIYDHYRPNLHVDSWRNELRFAHRKCPKTTYHADRLIKNHQQPYSYENNLKHEATVTQSTRQNTQLLNVPNDNELKHLNSR
jgi:hypothetical protein